MPRLETGERTRMAAVARRASGWKPTVYAQVGSKEGLSGSVVIERVSPSMANR
ncbi:MAG: hypothetical protein ABI650_10445 [Dokdonella sp.]